MSLFDINAQITGASGSTDGQSVPVSGEYVFYGSGTFGGGTLTFQVSPDDTLWVDLATGITSAGRQVHKVNQGEFVRATLAGATAATVDVDIR